MFVHGDPSERTPVGDGDTVKPASIAERLTLVRDRVRSSRETLFGGAERTLFCA